MKKPVLLLTLFTACLVGISSADIIVDPDEISEDLLSGDEVERTLTIENTGAESIYWYLLIEYDDNEEEQGLGDTGYMVKNISSAPVRRDEAGDEIEEFNVPYAYTTGLAWDGQYMWGVSYNDDRLYAINPANGRREEIYVIHDRPTNLTYDGEYFWIGSRWRDSLYVYDIDGELIETFNPPDIGSIDGIASDGDGILFINEWDGRTNDGSIHVIEVDEWDEIAEIEYRDEVNRVDLDCICWVESHQFGKLWASAPGRIYQLHVNEEWEVQVIQNFRCGIDEEYAGLAHDGVNIWHGMMTESSWYMLDDGTGENAWLEFDFTEGELERNAEVELTVTINVLALFTGIYEAEIHFFEENDEEPDAVVPVMVEVQGLPNLMLDWEIGIDENLINWNEYYHPIFVDTDYIVAVNLRNSGTEDLIVEEIYASNGVFSAEPSELSIPIGENRDVEFIYNSDEPSETEAVMTILSNDPDNSRITIDLIGEALLPPEFSVDPIELEDELFSGETSELTLTVSNEGRSNLEWECEIREDIENRARRDIAERVVRRPDAMPFSKSVPPRRDEAGDVIEEYDVPYNNTSGLAWDGEYMWGTFYSRDRLIALDPETGDVENSFRIHNRPNAMAYSGGTIWIAEWMDETIFVYDTEGELVDQFECAFDNIQGLTFVNELTIWATTSRDEKIHAISPVDGEEFYSIDLPEELEDENIGSIGWAYRHGKGALWALARNHIYALEFDEDLQPEVFFDFEVDVDGNVVGLIHDDSNLWYGSWNDEKWTVIDDGITESHWISVRPHAATLEQNESMEVSVLLNVYGMVGGDYELSIVFSTNDPQQFEFVVPVYLTVNGAPEIHVMWEQGMLINQIRYWHYYDELYNGGEYGVDLTIRNFGTDVLEAEFSTSDPDVFHTEVEELQLEVEELETITCFFTPPDTGVYYDTLNISSNDRDEGELKITLIGRAYDAPMITVNPMSIDDDLLVGEDSEHLITLGNEGGTVLRWEAEIVTNPEEFAPDRDRSIRQIRRGGDHEPHPIPQRDDAGDIIEEYDVPFFATEGLAWDGNWVWGIAYNDWALYALNPENGDIELEVDIDFTPNSLAFDGVNFWVIEEWQETLHRFDSEGNHLERIRLQNNFEIESLGGIAWDGAEYLILNDSERRNLHYVSPHDFEEIAVVSYREEINEWCSSITYVPEHTDGEIWLLADFTVYQLDVSNMWEAELIDRFEVEAERSWCGITHDGKNLWHGRWNDDLWVVVDDGITEMNWITVDSISGEIETGDELDLFVSLNAADIYGGEYEALIRINSNDPDDGVVDVEVSLTVTGIPGIEVEWEGQNNENLIDWNEIHDPLYTDARYDFPLKISSTGTDDLQILAIEIDNDHFTADSANLVIRPEEFEMVGLSFISEEADLYEANLTLISNAAENDTIHFNLSAQSRLHPVMVIDPQQISENLMENETSEFAAAIANDGESDLVWTSRLVLIDDEEDSLLIETGPRRDEPGEIVREYEVEYWETAGLAWDGTLMWGITFAGNLIAIDPNDGEMIHDFNVDPGAYLALTIFNDELLTIEFDSGNLYRFDFEGDLIGEIELNYNDIYGVANINERYLIITDTNVGYFVVLDSEFEEVAEFNVEEHIGGHQIWCTNWVDIHPDGQFWCLTRNTIYQFGIDADWNVEPVQDFRRERAGYAHEGISHDGMNLWHGSWDNNRWYVIDDGVDEVYWISYEPTRGTVMGMDWTDLFITINSEDLEPGEYKGAIVFESNDPTNEESYLEIQLDVFRNVSHFTEFTPTYRWHRMTISSLTFDGRTVPTGWEIGVFTDSGVLAGSGLWHHSLGDSVVFLVYGDDPLSAEVEGFEDEEEMFFRIWNADSHIEYVDSDSIRIVAAFDNRINAWSNLDSSVVSIACDRLVGVRESAAVPEETYIYPAYPNPFNAVTRLEFGLTSPTVVNLQVFDVYGRRIESIINGQVPAGHHHAKWNASGIPSGTYLIRFESGEVIKTMRVMLIR